MTALIDPLKVRNLAMRNRIVLPPMITFLASKTGEATEQLVNHYTRRARGPGLVIVEHSYFSKEGQLTSYGRRREKVILTQLGIYDDSLVDGLARLVEAVHKFDTPIAIQINHAGRRTNSEGIGMQPVAPSPIPASEDAEIPRELSVDEIKNITKEFGKAAHRALSAGFDAVEIHGAHGHLLNQFLSPLANKRTDLYGKDLEGRMRFPLEVVREVRAAVKDRPLLFRLGADDRMPQGLTLEDGRKIAMKLASEGVDIIDASGGLCGHLPSDLKEEGFFVHLAEGIKGVVNVPVIGVGGIVTADFADRVVRDGRADLVAVGRSMLRDPDWATKAIVQHSKK